MSQQPPYGQDPQQPYQQPFTPYSQGGYPNPYAQVPQRPNHTTRNVLLIVGAVVLLFCGGLFALGVVFFNNVDDAFDPDYTGSENDPISVEEGEAFSIRGFDYDSGWAVSSSPTGDVEITGLRGTNNRDDEDSESVYLYFEFYQDNARLASIACSGGGGAVSFERSIRLTCTGFGEDIAGYDEIEVYDNSYSE